MLPLRRMRVISTLVAALTLFLIACGADPQPDHQAEWRNVLLRKQEATAANAPIERKQIYADSVRAFVEKHPTHGRAREVWHRLQLEFADDLAGAGRYQDSLRFYRAVLAHDPQNQHARIGYATAVDRLAVTREKLLTLRKGMSHREVSSLLGKPMPGWSVKQQRGDATFEAWYYRTRAGEVAGVYFRDGKVFAAEESSNSQVARLSS